MICKIYKPRISFLFSLLLLSLPPGCGDNSIQPGNVLYPEAVKQNIDAEQLADAFAEAKSISALQGLAVARNDVIVAEEYFNNSGPDPDPNIHVMSVTKSITATLIGIAINSGYIQSINQTVSDYLKAEVDTVNPALGRVTIRQLMTMTCGHNWYEIGPVSEFSDFVNAPNQLNYILNKPIVNTPGTVFNYSDGAAHLTSVIIFRATGMSASAFADKYLFDPMGLGTRTWYSDRQGYSYGGVRLCIGIHDMIKIGYLYLHDGYYNGRQIVPADWINNVTAFQMKTNNEVPFLTDYGYYWWLGSAYGQNFVCANGYGGQFIFIVKNLNLVIVSRTDYRNISDTKAGENWYNVLNIIINKILPAVRPD